MSKEVIQVPLLGTQAERDAANAAGWARHAAAIEAGNDPEFPPVKESAAFAQVGIR